MRLIPATAMLLLAAACSAPPPPPGAADPVLEKLRAGEAPAELRYDKNPVWTAEIGKALAENRAWKSDADAFAAIAHFAAHAGPDQLPVVESLLADAQPERRMRGLLITRLSPSEEMPKLLQRYAAPLLDPATPQVAKVAVGAMGYRRVRGATEAILGYYDTTDDPAALRALGRIWEGAPHASGHWLTVVHLLLHKLTMSPAATPESADALLRVMGLGAFKEFLEKWASEAFPARELIVAAAGAKDFDPVRGKQVHEAFLKSPDADLVTTILWNTPYKLDPAAVKPLLDDVRVSKNGAKVCDYAAARLESLESGLPPELPADEVQRERLLKKWRSRR